MVSMTSSEFLKEFTITAERANDEKETFIIQRANGKNVVLMSMDSYNALRREIYAQKIDSNARRHDRGNPEGMP